MIQYIIIGWKGGAESPSGAYLFLPNGKAQPLQDVNVKNDYIIIDGPLIQRVYVRLRDVVHIVQLNAIDQVHWVLSQQLIDYL